MSSLETYRDKARECAHAADQTHDSRERAELVGLASVYMALADYVERRHEHGSAHRGEQHQDMRFVNRKDQRQLENLRRGEADTAKQVAKSQEAIEDSLALLQHM